MSDGCERTCPLRNTAHYQPQENPRRYPLELAPNLHICLWNEDGVFKWTIALFDWTREGYELRFIGDRPLDRRVNWEHFREVVEQGQRIADERFAASEL